MQALSIPTTRSLTLISLPSLPVVRERLEHGCILTRVAPSFLRIGSFEAFSPPTSMFFLGGGQQEAHWDALRILGEWCIQRVLRLDLNEGEAWGKKLVLEVARRNAIMVAGWQAYGFMHGVINTDKCIHSNSPFAEELILPWLAVFLCWA
jgi:serine/tyrosine/threonine adenylyltransferase